MSQEQELLTVRASASIVHILFICAELAGLLLNHKKAERAEAEHDCCTLHFDGEEYGYNFECANHGCRDALAQHSMRSHEFGPIALLVVPLLALRVGGLCLLGIAVGRNPIAYSRHPDPCLPTQIAHPSCQPILSPDHDCQGATATHESLHGPYLPILYFCCLCYPFL